MCGISCSYRCPTHHNKRLLNRGPDHQNSVRIRDKFILTAYILYVQGHCKQPCHSENHHLLYNGQIFDYPQAFGSDTEYLLHLISDAGVLATAQQTSGPHSIIVYDEDKDKLWFWRDYFGRRSLLISQRVDGFLLSSVGDSGSDWVEVPSCGIFCFSNSELTCYPYDDRQEQCLQFGEKLDVTVVISSETLRSPISALNTNPDVSKSLDWESQSDDFIKLLFKSVQKRDACCSYPLRIDKDRISDYISRHCYCVSEVTCTVHQDWIPSNARVAVLFSGGIDCTVLAGLLHRSVPENEPIDLLNVSFGDVENTPDRLSAVASYEDLQRIAPNRVWNLIKVNVSREELSASRDRHITDLLFPHNTVLDDSIGCALWFAARGAGVCQHKPMLSSARLLFSGIGADELMGGYSRHRGAWQNGHGIEGVISEIQKDINRISERNLGRDNRVIGDHMRDSVAPFLDEEFVSFVNSLPIQYKVNFTLPRGQGEKIILRRVAEKLGLRSSSLLPKKAIQFGSKIAKLEGKKEKGGDVCQRLNKKKFRDNPE